MNKKGFTLIEMMIVVIIISGLMYLIVPNIINSKESIDNKTCDAYIELVDSQIQAYILDTDQSPLDLNTLYEAGYITSTTCPNGEVLTIVNNETIKVVTTTTTVP